MSVAIFEKTMKIIRSCKTLNQIYVASNYFHLAKKYMDGDEINQLTMIMRIHKDKLLKI